MTNKLRPITLAITAVLAANQAIAAELEPVIVESDFRPTTIDQSTTSAAVITEFDIQKKNAQHLEQVLSSTANVNAASGASRSRYFQIRGIGERSQFNTPLNPSVGLFIDGIDYSRTGSAGTLFDVKQVDVLRGPQGTTFGSSSLAGTINIVSNEATGTPEAKIQGTAGSRNTADLGVMVNGPLVKNKLMGRLSVFKHTSDGYMENTYLNKKNTQLQDEVTTKANLKWLANEDLTFDLNFIGLDINNGYDAFSFENDYTTSTDEPGDDILKSAAVALKTTYKVNPKVNLEATITKSDSETLYSYDDDWTYTGQYSGGYSAKDNYARTRKNQSLDLRFLSSESGRIFNNSTDWVAGLYYISQDEKLDRTYPYITNGRYLSQYETVNKAAYGQFDHHLSAKTTITSGLRVEQFTADFKDSYNFKKSTDETLFGGKLALNHKINPAHTGYIALSKGYKAGGVNNDASLPDSKLSFDTESLWNLETGLNSNFLDGDLKTRLTVFYAKRIDQQVNSSTQIPNTPNFTIYLDNAATAENYGLEAEADWQTTEDLRLLASLGLLQATFIDYTYVDPNNTSNTISLNGREQAHAPSYQYSVGMEYFINNNWLWSANIEGKDKFYFSNSHDKQSKPLNLINSSLEYNNKNWTVNIWGRNLTDEKYATRGFFFGIDPRTGYTDDLYTQQGEPRTLGVTVSYDY
jgi:outer membrane receptor protein involved in Fe transport